MSGSFIEDDFSEKNKFDSSDEGFLPGDDSSTAVLAEEFKEELADNEGPSCENCGLVGQDTSKTWCQQCGYYAVIGHCVSLTDDDREEGPSAAPVAVAAPSYFGIFQLIPIWGRVLLLQLSLLLVASVAARILLETGSKWHVVWSLAQLGIGLMLFGAAHVLSYLIAIVDDSGWSLTDIVIRPFAIWGPTIAELPTTSRRVQAGASGIVTAILAVVVVGGLPYHWLWSWGPEEKAEVNLLAAIAERVPEQADDGGDLTDAMESFANSAGVPRGALETDPEGRGSAVPVEEPMQVIDCLILGYRPLGEDDFSSLVLVGQVDGAVRVVGSVSEGISSEVRTQLNRRMAEIKRSSPFVPTNIEAVWLEPVLTCRIQFTQWSPLDQLEQPTFEKLLAEIER